MPKGGKGILQVQVVTEKTEGGQANVIKYMAELQIKIFKTEHTDLQKQIYASKQPIYSRGKNTFICKCSQDVNTHYMFEQTSNFPYSSIIQLFCMLSTTIWTCRSLDFLSTKLQLSPHKRYVHFLCIRDKATAQMRLTTSACFKIRKSPLW